MAASPAHLPAADAQFHNVWGAASDVMRKRGVVAGLADEAIELVGKLGDAGAARVNIAIRPPVDWEALHAWTAEVMPVFRE
ncbi:MAG: hypothetical protein ABI939_04665 [Anaerolineaceae bacterium]